MKKERKKSFFIRILLLIVIPLIIITIVATMSFVIYQQTISFNEFLIRGELLSKQAAHLVEMPILEQSYFDLIDAIDTISREKGVVHVHVMDTDGTIIESSNHKIRKGKSPHTSIKAFTWEEYEEEQLVHFLYPILGGVKGFTCVELSKEQMNNEVRTIFIMTMMFLFVFIGLSILISYLISRSIIKPINKLQVTFKEVSEGNLLAPIDTSRMDELGNLARSFSHTRDEIVRHINELKGKERTEKALEMAASVQLAMLPQKTPDIQGYDCAADSRVAKEVGGDFYDIIALEKEKYLILIGDVSGKGIQAALYMNVTMSIIYTVVHEFISKGGPVSSFSLLHILETLNDVLNTGMKRANFVTLFLGILDTRQHVLRFTSSGHEPGILYNPKEKKYEELKTGGQPCGVVSKGLFKNTLEEGTALIEAGTYVLFNTDGITDVCNRNSESYRKHYLERVKTIEGHESAEKIVGYILEGVKQFFEGEPQQDDITVVCLKRRPL
jgi:serine phosphatase RsbU (regulator of sigma subunit)/uncharacterized membrane protein affecting hemolysin expression